MCLLARAAWVAGMTSFMFLGLECQDQVIGQLPCVTHILVSLNNKNLESDRGVNAEDWRSKAVSHCSSFTPTNAQIKGTILSSDCISRLHLSSRNLRLHWAPVSFSLILLSPPSHITPVSTSPDAGIKGVESQVLGSPLCELCFSFRQIQYHVAQGGLEFTEIYLTLSPECWA